MISLPPNPAFPTIPHEYLIRILPKMPSLLFAYLFIVVLLTHRPFNGYTIRRLSYIIREEADHGRV